MFYPNGIVPIFANGDVQLPRFLSPQSVSVAAKGSL